MPGPESVRLVEVELLIGGAGAKARGGAVFERLDPVTGKRASYASAARKADVDLAVGAAAGAFADWSKTGPGERRDLLLRAGEIMASKAEEFARLMLVETGSTALWAAANVKQASGILREAASMTTQIGGEIIPASKPGTLAMAVRRPAGVCVGIAPWNAPVILATRAIAMALACGNTVVLKSSELCPATHRLVGQVLAEAGFPDGVVNVISNAPNDAAEVVEALISHPKVRRVNFTGSTRVGKIVALLAAEHLKPALLELGGKAPLIVLDDADLDAAVNATVFGAFMNQGQICMSTERIIVDVRIADVFVVKLARRTSDLSAGDPRGKPDLGPLISAESAARMAMLINDAVSKGAQIIAGGQRENAVVQATIIDKVVPGMRIYDEESFGPVKPVIRVSGDEQAIHVANDTEYGLSAAVFSRDIQRALDVAGRIESGICHINGPTVGDEPQMPFGGVKSSGLGRFGGRAGIAEFTDLRWITIENPDQHYPF